MKKKFNEAIKHPLISGSLIIFFGANFANLFQFLFNIIMTRQLASPDYGVLASLISLITISTIPAGAFVPTIVRFGGVYLAKEDYDMLRGFFFRVTKIWLVFGTIFLLTFIIFSESIGKFFRINDSFLILLAGVSVVLGFISIVNTGLLQAKLSFKFLSLTNFISSFSKFALGILLVYIGLAVKGVLLAILISAFLPFVLNFIPLTFLFKKTVKVPKIDNLELFKYSAPAAISLFGLTSFVSMDIILVKHFFDPTNAGIYAVISLLGRIIFFFTAPITTVMFPLIVRKHTNNENYHNTFKLSILLVLIPCIFLTLFYFIFPEEIIRLASREEYTSAAYLLGLFGVFITLYSLLFVLTNFYLSIRKTKVFIPIIIGSILQVILIWFLHSTFLQIVLISSFITGLLLILLLVYYWLSFRKNEK